jgi:WhiB family redox-sensing transcriptional regulator
MMSGPSWFVDAECRRHGPSKMYPDWNRPVAVREARAVCAPCPVRAECLEYALSTNEPYGVWGGYTRDERVKIRSTRRALERALR